ncbi:MAG: alpha/beta hydrolase [Muribaculaceae bacterium]|nr:alpha/beta hydrolase [Muribaculaceae bacterium]
MSVNVMKILKGALLVLVGIILAIVVIGGAVWLIDGRSPQAIIISRSMVRATMEDYEHVRGDTTDKSTVDIPDGIVFPREMRQYRVGNMQVFHMEPQNDSKPIVLYIHGGAYLNNFSEQHWHAMVEWAEVTGCGIVTPNYPLLYCYTASDAHPLMVQLYQQLLKQYAAKRLIIMGDSAGGGFTLALAQEIRNDSIDSPSHLVLISPWVDVLGGDDALQDIDTFLDAQVLRNLGADWAGDIDPRDPMISPLYGDMKNLPPTDLFTGTWEILYTDIASTCDKMKAAGVDARLHVAEKMGHVYPIWPCPEGSAARKEIAKIILQSE